MLIHPQVAELNPQQTENSKKMTEEGGVVEVHLHVHAVDASGVENFFRNNSAAQRNHLSLRKLAMGK